MFSHRGTDRSARERVRNTSLAGERPLHQSGGPERARYARSIAADRQDVTPEGLGLHPMLRDLAPVAHNANAFEGKIFFAVTEKLGEKLGVLTQVGTHLAFHRQRLRRS